jgi:nucleoside-diphosphate-sugar epimerase
MKMNQKKDAVSVVGGAGFIGSNLVDALIERGFDVRVIDDLSAGKKENVHRDATLHVVDVRNYEDLVRAMAGSTYVFHLAALPRVQYSIEHPKETHDVNVGGVLNSLLAAREAKAKRFIYSASSSAYGDQEILPLHEDMPPRPLSPYGLQKYEGELLCALFSTVYNLPTVSLRYFNVYGPRLDP